MDKENNKLRIHILENELAAMRKAIAEKEIELYELKKSLILDPPTAEKPTTVSSIGKAHLGQKLPKWAIERYSRQILIPEIGVKGQYNICQGRVLIVGAGGLGCPSASYLAGAGIGKIGLVDYDTVEVTNIHRQLLHNEQDRLSSKVDSAADALRRINSQIKIEKYNVQLDSSNALRIIQDYDVVLDCTDNVPTRYLLNDACVILKKPLVSGSALRLEGQLTIYNYRKGNGSDDNRVGPCYRCVFPRPPPPAASGSCAERGVCGPVTGAIGTLQALECLKILCDYSQSKLLVGRMMIFDGDEFSIKIVKLRPRNLNCEACSDSEARTIKQLLDYETFCSTKAVETSKTQEKLVSGKRKEEKFKRMIGQSYYGFRRINEHGNTEKWVQDVLKNSRNLGPACNTDYCKKRQRHCHLFDENSRREIFENFWNNLDWDAKKNYVRSLVDNVAPKKRRKKIKSDMSRKVSTKNYHFYSGNERVRVCRLFFINTLGVKETMTRNWLGDFKKVIRKRTQLKSTSAKVRPFRECVSDTYQLVTTSDGHNITLSSLPLLQSEPPRYF